MARLPAMLIAVAGVLVSSGSPIRAQAPGIGGTWRLDETRSKVSPGAGLFGLIGAGVPATVHITAPANGTLVVESQINEGHARMYAPRGKTTTPVGQAGTITMVSRWNGRTLTAEGTQESAAGQTTTVRQVKEVYTLSADGATLTIDVAVTSGEAVAASTLIFARITSVGGCETWPTPCKRAP